MRPLSERMYRAAFAVVFVAGGAVVGYGVHAIVAPTPPACHDMADYAIEAFQLWADTTGAVRERGDANDPEAYAVLDAEVNHLTASLTALAPKYDVAEIECLGGAR